MKKYLVYIFCFFIVECHSLYLARNRRQLQSDIAVTLPTIDTDKNNGTIQVLSDFIFNSEDNIPQNIQDILNYAEEQNSTELNVETIIPNRVTRNLLTNEENLESVTKTTIEVNSDVPTSYFARFKSKTNEILKNSDDCNKDDISEKDTYCTEQTVDIIKNPQKRDASGEDNDNYPREKKQEAHIEFTEDPTLYIDLMTETVTLNTKENEDDNKNDEKISEDDIVERVTISSTENKSPEFDLNLDNPSSDKINAKRQSFANDEISLRTIYVNGQRINLPPGVYIRQSNDQLRILDTRDFNTFISRNPTTVPDPPVLPTRSRTSFLANTVGALQGLYRSLRSSAARVTQSLSRIL